MNRFRHVVILTLIMMTCFAITSCAQAPQAGVQIEAGEQVMFHATYADLTLDEQIQQADVIASGTVASISGTRWNQDSGEYWEELVKDEGGETLHVALPYYTVDILIDRPIVNTVEDLADTLTVTVVGMSPEDASEIASEEGIASGETVAHAIAGDSVVVFLQKSELSWRDGSRPILMMMSAPERSYLVQGKDGLYRMPVDEQSAVSLDQLFADVELQRSEKTE